MLDTVRGQIRSAWTGGGAVREVTVPPNAVAEVHVPVPAGHVLHEGGHPAAGQPGVRLLRVEGGVAVLEVGSGSYRFTTVRPAPAAGPPREDPAPPKAAPAPPVVGPSPSHGAPRKPRPAAPPACRRA